MKLKISCSVIFTNIVITLSNVAQQSSSITNRELHQIYIYIYKNRNFGCQKLRRHFISNSVYLVHSPH